MYYKRLMCLALAVILSIAVATNSVSAQVESQAKSQTAGEAAAETFTFRVRIQNTSADNDPPILFAPGVWVLHSEAGPLFTSGEADRDEGLEALAEDGDPTALAASLLAKGLTSGNFDTPVCADSPRPLQSREFYEFEVTASPETPYLSFATMLVQSNDLFLAPVENGIALFDEDGKAIGLQNVTHELLLWDAGTEANEEPGTGPNQAPRQSVANTGPSDQNATVRPVDDESEYPDIADLVRVYIVPVPMVERDRGRQPAPPPDNSIGEEFQVGDVQWRVLSAHNLGHELKNEKGDRQTTDERFIQVRFQFLNVGSDPLDFEAVEDLPLHDSQGREYVQYRVPGIPTPHYPKEFIVDDEECFGRWWFGRWQPFVHKPNSLTTCSTIYEIKVDATGLVLTAGGLGSSETHNPKTVGLDLPPTSPRSIGDVMQVGDVRWQVLSFEDHGHVIEANGVKEKTRERFIELRFQVTNKGSEDLDLSGAVLRDGQGREYERGKFNLISESERCVGGIVGQYKLKPNVITTCTSIYEVPQDSTEFVLIAGDLGGADASSEIVSLGLSDLQPVRLFFVDEDVEVGDMCWRVLSVEELGQDLMNEEGDTETTEGRFVKVQFQLLNQGTDTLGYDGVILEDNDGRKYSHFGDRLEYIDDEVECPPSLIPPRTYSLKPNTPTICTAILEVAKDSEKFALRANDLEGYESTVIVFSSVAAAAPPRCVDPGTYEVGEDCPPGVYRGEAREGSICKWARLSDLNQDPDSIIAMGLHEGPFYVEVQSDDIAFTTECELAPIAQLEPRDRLLASVPSGMYVVGLDIAPGKYKGEPQEDLFCFWQRLSNFRGEDNSTIAWDLAGEEYVVEVDAMDFAVEFHCPVVKVE